MKSLILLLFMICAAKAQVVTVVAAYDETNENRYVDFVVERYQTAELLSIFPLYGAVLRVEKDGITATEDFGITGGRQFRSVTVAGPAVIHIFRGSSGGATGVMATFRMTPEPYRPDLASIVSPGPGGANVILQCSTNLVDWQSATNGVYTNQPVAKFFRIRLDRIPSSP